MNCEPQCAGHRPLIFDMPVIEAGQHQDKKWDNPKLASFGKIYMWRVPTRDACKGGRRGNPSSWGRKRRAKARPQGRSQAEALAPPRISRLHQTRLRLTTSCSRVDSTM